MNMERVYKCTYRTDPWQPYLHCEEAAGYSIFTVVGRVRTWIGYGCLEHAKECEMRPGYYVEMLPTPGARVTRVKAPRGSD